MTDVAAPYRTHASVMGTECSFLIEMDEGRDAEAAVQAALCEMRRLEAIFTTFDPTSPMSRLRREEIDLGQAPPEVADVLELCREMNSATAGFFDAFALPGGVDPTGLSKGWIVERATSLLPGHGASAALVNCGGDIASVGVPTSQRWRVGIRHPWRPGALAAVAELLPGKAVATSGRYERGDHLLDPFTGTSPPRPAASASALGPSLPRADAFATALAVAGPALIATARALGYESYVISDDGDESSSPGFPFAGPA